jgi:large subunit ribosomal protein L21
MKYAIVESGGKQYKAVEGGTLEVDRLPVEPGVEVKLEQVLLLVDGETISVGAPLIKDSPIWTRVMEHFKGEKVTIFNYSPKKRIRVKTGHRQNYTRLRVEQIGGSELLAKDPAPKVEKKVKAVEPVEKVKQKPAKKTEPKPVTKAASTPEKTATKKPATKPAAKKPKASAEKTPKSGTKKPTTSAKKPAEKK